MVRFDIITREEQEKRRSEARILKVAHNNNGGQCRTMTHWRSCPGVALPLLKVYGCKKVDNSRRSILYSNQRLLLRVFLQKYVPRRGSNFETILWDTQKFLNKLVS